MAGFVQIAMDFGFPPAEGEVLRTSSDNGTHDIIDPVPQPVTSTVQEAALTIMNVNRPRLTPPPADRILAQPESEKENLSESPVEDLTQEIPTQEPIAPPVVEESAESEKVEIEEDPIQVESETSSTQEIFEQTSEPFEYSTPEVSELESIAEALIEDEDDGLIEFELDYSFPEEVETDFEKQIATVYFEKASPEEEEGEEVIEIPIFNKPANGPDAHPVMIVRVKEKKESGSSRARTSPSKRGRKSVREMMADAEMLSVPDDEILFQKQYYPIGEVAAMFSVNTSLIRFWETEFDIIKPKKNKKGDRFFRPVDVKNLHLIYNLLRLKKFTIEGAKEYLKNNRKKAEKNFEVEQSLKRIKHFLLQLKAEL